MGIGGRMGEMAPRPCAALPAGDLPASGGGDGARRRSGCALWSVRRWRRAAPPKCANGRDCGFRRRRRANS